MSMVRRYQLSVFDILYTKYSWFLYIFPVSAFFFIYLIMITLYAPPEACENLPMGKRSHDRCVCVCMSVDLESHNYRALYALWLLSRRG